MRRTLLAALSALALTLPVGLLTSSAHAYPYSGGFVAITVDPPQIPAENAMAHLQQFQTIADNNGRTRAHGTSGYRASADYVKAKLDAAGFTTTLQSFSYNGATGYNVIAEWPYGDANNIIFAGAHLDSVRAGPGLNDNGSGSAAVLENALAVARANLRPEKRIKFGWWGAEELGLIGSEYYTSNLGSTERAKIDAYLNFDMVGQKDITTWGVYNHNSSISALFKQYFSAQGIGTYDISWNGSSDHSSFSRYGITVGGIGSGDDPCYHSACDTINNVGSRVMGHSTNAIAYALWNLAGGTGTPPADDFSMSLSPTSGSVEPGASLTSTVSTAVTNGKAQTVNLSASGLPNGVSAAFNPSSVTAGSSSTMTLATTAAATPGTYTITVTGTGTTVTRTAAFTLTVNGTTPGTCGGYESTFQGTLSGGSSEYQPDGSWFYTGSSGTHEACLDGPDGTDFDLYLQKWTGYGWSTVDRSTSSGPDEAFTYNGTSGYYRYRVHAYSGSGAYTLGYNAP